jgi:hypothetical protein
MKGAKGGNRDRIISWLFSERTRKKREEELELEKIEENKIDEKRKERRKSKKKNNEVEENKPVLNLETKEEIKVSEEEKALISTPPVTLNQALEQSEKAEDVSYEEDDLDLTLIDIFDTSRDKKKPNKKKETADEIEVLETNERIPIKDKQPPTLFIDEDVVLTDKYAIATHSDKDFWVVDSENWFAAGKVCTAPTLIAKRAAEKYGLVPAIYLEAKIY